MTRRGFLRVGAVLGALLTCAPVLGIFGAMLGMTRAFRALDTSGISDPHALSQGIARTMMITAGGIALLPCGIVLLLVCVLLLKRSSGSEPPPLPRFAEGSAPDVDKR